MWDIVWVSPQGHRSVSVSCWPWCLQTPQQFVCIIYYIICTRVHNSSYEMFVNVCVHAIAVLQLPLVMVLLVELRDVREYNCIVACVWLIVSLQDRSSVRSTDKPAPTQSLKLAKELSDLVVYCQPVSFDWDYGTLPCFMLFPLCAFVNCI